MWKSETSVRVLFAAFLLVVAVPLRAAEAGSDVVGTVGDLEITRAELEAEVEADLDLLRQQQQQILEAGLERLLETKLFEVEAAARGITVDELTAAEATAPEPTVEELDAFYEAQKAGFPAEMSKEELLERIRAYLHEEATAKMRGEFVGTLQAKHAIDWRLEAFRFKVATEGSPARGPENAPVTLIEFSDFECPYCRKFIPTLDQIVAKYGNQIRLVYRHLPLESIHANARAAAEASLCAGDQDKFWAMHDALFAGRSLTPASQREMAESIGLDLEAYDACLATGAATERVNADIAAARELGLSGTPVLFVNGEQFTGAQSFGTLVEAIDKELAAVAANAASPTSAN